MKKLPNIKIQKNNCWIIGLSVVLLFIGSILAQRASAQVSQRTITIVPPTVQKAFNHGATSEGVMKVINDSSETLTFAVSVQDYIVTDKSGTPNLLPPDTLNNKYSAASWIGVTPYSFTIEPHKTQVLNYYLQIPANAKPGGHYAAVIYTPITPGGNLENSGAAVKTQAGTLFYITVNGPITEQAKIISFLANLFQEYGPVKITTEIQNLGDLHIAPNGQITVKDILGRNIVSSPLATRNIYPGNTSLMYENKVGQTLMVGRFTANLTASYGKNNNLPLLATVSFWVFPWKIAIIIVLIIVATILGGMYWRKKKTTPKTQEEVKTEQPAKPAK